jgi:hypothetical protein
MRKAQLREDKVEMFSKLKIMLFPDPDGKTFPTDGKIPHLDRNVEAS